MQILLDIAGPAEEVLTGYAQQTGVQPADLVLTMLVAGLLAKSSGNREGIINLCSGLAAGQVVAVDKGPAPSILVPGGGHA